MYGADVYTTDIQITMEENKMKRTRFSGLVLLTLFVTIVWFSPLFATGDPWDGTKVVDTLDIRGGGIYGSNSSDDPDNPGGDDGTLLGDILKWLQDSLGLTGEKKVSNHKDLRSQGTKEKYRKTYDPVKEYKIKE